MDQQSQNQTQKIRRKRDFSQVVDPTANKPHAYGSGNSAANSPSKMKNSMHADASQNQQVYKHYLENNALGEKQAPHQPKQFSTIQATAQSHLGINSAAADAEKLKINAKNAKKTHLRSITQQKGEAVDAVSHGQRNGGRRQPSASAVSGKHRGEEKDKDTGKE